MRTGIKSRKWSEEDKKNIIDMICNGDSLVTIGQIYNREHSTIIRQLKKWNIQTSKLRRELVGKAPINKANNFKHPPHKFDGIIYNLNQGRSYASYLHKEEKKKTDLSKWLMKNKLQKV
jgi:IS30 family transposase